MIETVWTLGGFVDVMRLELAEAPAWRCARASAWETS